MENKIKLYQFEDCSFCEKVRAKLEELGFEYGKINVPRDRESTERKMLFEKSGVYSIPRNRWKIYRRKLCNNKKT